jgi:hypothetical protein
MNDDRNGDTGGSRGRRRRAGLRQAGVLAAAVAGIALLAAACGGGSSAAAGSATRQQLLAYARCMRSHGVPDWPDPTSQGTFVATGIDAASNQVKQANFACQYLLPNDGLPAASGAQEQLLRQSLKYALCMRSHGILNFPDPVRAGDEGVAFPIAGYDPGSPQVQSANKACNGPGS